MMHRRYAFTLIELLVVISIIALLIALLLPALSKAQERIKTVNCSSNMRQLGVAQYAHASDHAGEYTTARGWVFGGTTDFEGVKRGELWPYVNGAKEIYLCPIGAEALRGNTANPLVRNYVQNWNVGKNWSNPPQNTNKHGWNAEELNEGNIRNPSRLVIFSEENTFTISGYSTHPMNDGYLLARNVNGTTVNSAFVDCFASLHNTRNGDLRTGDSNAVFGDGHVEFVNYLGVYQWNGQTIYNTVMYCTDEIPRLN